MKECDGVALPTVASLCRALGKHLYAADGFVVPETPVTAVHISELVDPTLYVSGGELLLTTDLTLPTSRIGWEGYISRLKSIGIWLPAALQAANPWNRAGRVNGVLQPFGATP